MGKRIRQQILTWWEDLWDRLCYERAIREFRKDPITYSHEEMKKILDLDTEK